MKVVRKGVFWLIEKLSRVVKVIANVVFILTLVVGLIFSIFTVPRLFGVKPFVVQSASMEPTIPTGSVVFVNTKNVYVEVDDIITFSLAVGEDKSVFVTHRAYDISDDGLIQTKGDNNDAPDGWLEPSAVTGTYLFHIPWCGFVLDQLQDYGFVLVTIWVFVINVMLAMLGKILELCAASKEKTE